MGQGPQAPAAPERGSPPVRGEAPGGQRRAPHHQQAEALMHHHRNRGGGVKKTDKKTPWGRRRDGESVDRELRGNHRLPRGQLGHGVPGTGHLAKREDQPETRVVEVFRRR